MEKCRGVRGRGRTCYSHSSWVDVAIVSFFISLLHSRPVNYFQQYLPDYEFFYHVPWFKKNFINIAVIAGVAEGGYFQELCFTRLHPCTLFSVVIHSTFRCTVRHFAVCNLFLSLCHAPLIVQFCLVCLPLLQFVLHKIDWGF